MGTVLFYFIGNFFVYLGNVHSCEGVPITQFAIVEYQEDNEFKALFVENYLYPSCP